MKVGLFTDTTERKGADIVHVFARTGDLAWIREALAQADGDLLLTLEPRDAAGNIAWPDDGEIAAIAAALAGDRAARRRGLLVRYAHEMNGTWYPWAGDPGRFRQEWVRFFLAMPSAVRLVWCPNAWRDFDDVVAYLPTVCVPEVVGVDGYSEDGRSSFGDVLGPALLDLREHCPNALLMVCETAAPRGQRQARWVEGMWSWVAHRAPEVAAVCWFSLDKERPWALSAKAREAFLRRGADR